jgi:hypothetical protein
MPPVLRIALATFVYPADIMGIGAIGVLGQSETEKPGTHFWSQTNDYWNPDANAHDERKWQMYFTASRGKLIIFSRTHSISVSVTLHLHISSLYN